MWRTNTIALILLTLAACYPIKKDRPQPVEGDSLNKVQVVAHISGNTETWTKGGAYYAPNGDLNALWDGKELTGTWKVSDDGELCVVIEAWGSDDACHRYVDDNGVIKLLHDNETRAAEIVPGNQLSSL